MATKTVCMELLLLLLRLLPPLQPAIETPAASASMLLVVEG